MNRRRRRASSGHCLVDHSIGMLWFVLAILVGSASGLSDGKISSLYHVDAQPRHIQVTAMQIMDTRTRARLSQKQLEKKSPTSMKKSKDQNNRMQHPTLTQPPKFSPTHAPSKYHDIFQMIHSPIAYRSKGRGGTDSPTNCGENGSSKGKSTKNPKKNSTKSTKSFAPSVSKGISRSKGKGMESNKGSSGKGKGSRPPSKGVSPPSKGVSPPSKGVSPPSKGVSPPSKGTSPNDYYGQIEERFDIFTEGQGKRRHLYYNFPTCAPSEQPSLPTSSPDSPVTEAPVAPTSPSTTEPTAEPSTSGGEPSTAAPTVSVAPTTSVAPSSPPSTFSPTTASPTPIPGIRVSVSAFDVLYTFENGVVPSPTQTQYSRAGTTTASYIDLLFRGAFASSDDIIFVDSITTFGNFSSPGLPVTIEFNSELIFSLDSPQVPSQDSLDALVATFFDPPPQDALIAALTSVPSSDPFNDVTDTTYQVLVGAASRPEEKEGISINSPGTLGIGAAIFVVVLGAGALFSASRRRRQRQISKHSTPEMTYPPKSNVHPVGDETLASTQPYDGVSLLSSPRHNAASDEHEIEFVNDTEDSDVFSSTSTWEDTAGESLENN